jgi:E3 ubiquitin-protein ligase SIAH1
MTINFTVNLTCSSVCLNVSILVFQIFNGHNICGSCKGRLSECPSCTGKFINVRNISLEKFAATAVYPCKNVRDGYKETFTADDRAIT